MNIHDFQLIPHDIQQKFHDISLIFHDIEQKIHDIRPILHDIEQKIYDISLNLPDIKQNLHDIDQDIDDKKSINDGLKSISVGLKAKETTGEGSLAVILCVLGSNLKFAMDGSFSRTFLLLFSISQAVLSA